MIMWLAAITDAAFDACLGAGFAVIAAFVCGGGDKDGLSSSPSPPHTLTSEAQSSHSSFQHILLG